MNILLTFAALLKYWEMENKLNKAVDLSVCALAFSVPLPLGVSRFVLILCFFTFMLGARKSINFSRRLIPAVTILALYAILLMSAFYAGDPELVLKRVFGPALPLLILAIVSVLNSERLNFERILKSFILGNFVNIIFLFLFLFWTLFVENKVELYVDFYRFITETLSYFTHRTYSGFNIVIGIVFIIYLHRKSLIKRKDYLFYLTFVGISLFFIILNNSRVMSLCLIFVFLYFVITQTASKKRLLISVLLLLTVLGSLFLTDNRFSASLKEIAMSEKTFDDPRSDIWSGVIEIIKEKPYFGYGCANYEEVLAEKYRSIDCLYCYAYELGPHNQFLEVWAEIGIVGPLLLFVFFISLWGAVEDKEKRPLFMLSYLVVLFFFMFESAIYRYNGSLSVGFLLFLLSNHIFDSKDKQVEECNKVLRICLISLSCVSVLGMILSAREVKKETVKIGKIEASEVVLEKLPLDCSDKNVIVVVDENVANGFCYAYEGNSYFYRRVAFSNIKTRTDVKVFSVDCYVSEDFDGEWVRINTESCNKKGIEEKANSYYDMERKGVWQNLKFEIPEGRHVSLLYVKRQNSDSFRGLNGFVVYANPKIVCK